MAALCAAEDFFRSLDTSIEFFLYLLRSGRCPAERVTLAYGALWGVYRAVRKTDKNPVAAEGVTARRVSRHERPGGYRARTRPALFFMRFP